MIGRHGDPMNDFAGRPHKKRPEPRIPALSITNWLRGAAMHRNCHLDRAFSLLPRRRLGRMNAADRPTNGLVDSQTSDVGSIPIARSITHDDSIGLTHLKLLNLAKKWPVLDPKWTPVNGVNPNFPRRARRTESWSCRRACSLERLPYKQVALSKRV